MGKGTKTTKMKSIDLRDMWEIGRRGEMVPVSLEALRQKVLVATHIVEREIANFRHTVEIAPSIDPRDMVESLQMLLKDDATQELEDYKSIEPLIRDIRTSKEDEKDDGIEGLKSIIDISKNFDFIAFSVRKQLVDAHENLLQKYCLSFECEGRGLDIPLLRHQENKIIKWNTHITDMIKTIHEQLDCVDASRTPTEKYIADFNRILTLMDDVCASMLKVCNPMKHWVTADAAFSRKVLENVKNISQQRYHLKDKIKSMEYEKEKLDLKIKRVAWEIARMESSLNAIRHERKQLHSIDSNRTQHLSKFERALQKKNQEAKIIKARASNRQEHSAQAYDFMTAQLESIRTDMRKLDATLARLKSQGSSSYREQVGVEKKLTSAVEELRTELIHQEELQTQRNNVDHLVKSLKEELHDMEQQENALKRIREMKDSADTIKRIYHYGHFPTNIDDDKDILGEAIQLTAADLGMEWQSLYKKLPFMPPRKDDVRQSDIHEIDESSRKYPDYWGRQQAMKGLQLWRRLNDAANVKDLIHTLRKMRKQATARKIERQLLTTV